MKTLNVALITLYLLGAIEVTLPILDAAATSFNGSTIIKVDTTNRTISFRTREGDNWTLPVENPELLTKQEIAQGDQVSIEISPDDTITKIVKHSEQRQHVPRDTEERSE
jgi:hypothetical protein